MSKRKAQSWTWSSDKIWSLAERISLVFLSADNMSRHHWLVVLCLVINKDLWSESGNCPQSHGDIPKAELQTVSKPVTHKYRKFNESSLGTRWIKRISVIDLMQIVIPSLNRRGCWKIIGPAHFRKFNQMTKCQNINLERLYSWGFFSTPWKSLFL